MDRDLASIQQARELVDRARTAADEFARADQATVDRIVEAMGRAAEAAASALARLAVEETGMGRYEDKIVKNRFSAIDVCRYVLTLKTCGIIREDSQAKVTELAVPMGVVAALLPTTNPTSTLIYKALIAVKARNAIVFSPHPRATRCSLETTRVVAEGARNAGAPDGLILCMSLPTLDGTRELMRHRKTSVILATGGAYDPIIAILRERVAPERRTTFDLFAPPAGSIPDTQAASDIAEGLASAARQADPLIDPREMLAGVEQPVHILHGRGDRLIPASEGAKLQEALPATTWSRLTITRLFGHAAQDPFPSILRALHEVPRFTRALTGMLGVT